MLVLTLMVYRIIHFSEACSWVVRLGYGIQEKNRRFCVGSVSEFIGFLHTPNEGNGDMFVVTNVCKLLLFIIAFRRTEEEYI